MMLTVTKVLTTCAAFTNTVYLNPIYDQSSSLQSANNNNTTAVSPWENLIASRSIHDSDKMKEIDNDDTCNINTSSDTDANITVPHLLVQNRIYPIQFDNGIHKGYIGLNSQQRNETGLKLGDEIMYLRVVPMQPSYAKMVTIDIVATMSQRSRWVNILPQSADNSSENQREAIEKIRPLLVQQCKNYMLRTDQRIFISCPSPSSFFDIERYPNSTAYKVVVRRIDNDRPYGIIGPTTQVHMAE